jgi:hypothetical protein
MTKKKLIGIILAGIIIALIIGIYYGIEKSKYDQEKSEYDEWHQYHRDQIRYTDNETEEDILEIAENLNYSSLLNISRFEQGYVMSPSEYGRANYIDKEVIQYYWNRIGYLEKEKERGHCTMSYEAKVHYVKKVHIKMYKLESTYDWQKCLIETEPPTVSIDWYFEEPSQVVIYNSTDYELINAVGSGRYEYVSLERNYTNCYFIEMNLDYWRQTYSLAGGGSYFYQYVVLDQNGNLLMLYKQRIDKVS